MVEFTGKMEGTGASGISITMEGASEEGISFWESMGAGISKQGRLIAVGGTSVSGQGKASFGAGISLLVVVFTLCCLERPFQDRTTRLNLIPKKRRIQIRKRRRRRREICWIPLKVRIQKWWPWVSPCQHCAHLYELAVYGTQLTLTATIDACDHHHVEHHPGHLLALFLWRS